MDINIVGDDIAPGAGVELFDGPFRGGAPLSVLTQHGKQASGKVIKVKSADRVLVEIDQRRWWLTRAPERFNLTWQTQPESWVIAMCGPE